MSSNFLKWIKAKISNFDIFELGNSAVIFYLLMFGVMPLAVFLHIPSKAVEGFLSQNISLINTRIAFYLLIGVSSFILGYRYFCFKGINKKLGGFFDKKWNHKNISWVFIFIFVSSLIVKFIRILAGGYFHLDKNSLFTNSSYYSLIGFLDWLGPIALAIAFAYYFYLFKVGDERYKAWQRIAWLTFAFEFIYGFLSGSRFVAITPIVVYLIIKHYLYKPSLRRVAVVSVLTLFILMPIQNFYKQPKIFFNFYATPVDHQVNINSLNISQYVVDNSIGRVSQSRILADIFEKTDKFLYGRSLVDFFISLGPPRFIWKNKPLSVNASGNEFGRELGVLSPDDFQTSIAPNMVGDWYMNFGILGIIFGMFLMGGILRLIYEIFVKASNHSLSGVMIYAIIWIQVVKGMENFIAPVYAGMVKITLILLVINFLLTKQHKNV